MKTTEDGIFFIYENLLKMFISRIKEYVFATPNLVYPFNISMLAIWFQRTFYHCSESYFSPFLRIYRRSNTQDLGKRVFQKANIPILLKPFFLRLHMTYW